MSNEQKVEGKCNYHPTQDGGYCGQTAGMGTDHLGEGHCKYHGGASSGGAREGAGAPEQNTNSVRHALYAKTNNFYNNVIGEDIRTLVDDIFTDYLDEYRERHGEPTMGTEAELFRISVSYGKHVYADNWAGIKPGSLDSGHGMVDKETRTTEDGETYYKYKETVVAKGQARLSRDRRSWLKDLGLMGESPEAQQANALADGIDLTLSTDEKGALDSAFDTEPET